MHDATSPVWDDGAWAPPPALDGDAEADVCVVGLGGSGLAAVGELLRLGQRVVAIDAVDVAAGAAGRNGGFLLAGPAHFHHEAVAALGRERAVLLYRQTLAEIDRITAETPAAVRRVGSLRVARSAEEARDCDAQLAAMRADALPAEPYDGPEGRGLLIPTDGAFNPLLRCRLLAARWTAEGARLHARTPALSIHGDGVVTPTGRVRARRVLVCVDGGLERLLPELAGRVRTARLQMLATAPTREVIVPRPVYARWGYEYWQQLPDGRIALGGFRDRGGDAEWTTDAMPSAAVQALLEQFLRDDVGVRHTPITHRWTASVGYTADGLPVLAEVRPGVWAVGGYSGTGNVVGAIGGRAAAQLAVLGTSPLAVPLVGDPSLSRA
jgi:glycine/D-amino acid oxidase-like deaminating enzyme